MILHVYTIVHTLISLAAIFTGLVVVFGMLAGRRLEGWTKWFLITAVATTITGLFVPFHGFTPAIGLGVILLPFLALTIFARSPKHLVLAIVPVIRFIRNRGSQQADSIFGHDGI